MSTLRASLIKSQRIDRGIIYTVSSEGRIGLRLTKGQRTAIQEAEKAVSEMSEKMLIGVAFEYGKDSSEYSMAGGVRKSQRKRPARKATTDKSTDAVA